MDGDIIEEPLARAVLRHLASARGADDPLGSFARTVINGEATLRGAADFSLHSQGLAAAAEKAEQEQRDMSPEQRAEYEREANRLQGSPHLGGDEESH